MRGTATRSVPTGSIDALTSDAGGGLCRSSAGELHLARVHRDALLVAATGVVAAAGHDPDLGSCDEASCGLAAHGTLGPAVCAAAQRLARLPDAPPTAATSGAPLSAAVTDFTDALEGAADAIRACRQTAHAGEGCWFSAAPGVDGCGEILRLLHRCG